MNVDLFLLRFKKISHCFFSLNFFRALFYFHILPSIEHKYLLQRGFKTIVDIGANNGQFALACREWSPQAKIFSFEPLQDAAKKFNLLFKNNPNIKFFNYAIGPFSGKRYIHVSSKSHSSSMLPIGPLQADQFPGTQEVGLEQINIAPLDFFITNNEINSPSILKIDVQGYEFEVLQACHNLIQNFDYIYCECSFEELYEGQKLAPEIFAFLSDLGFEMEGFYNAFYGDNKKTLQADFLFRKVNVNN